MYSSVATVSCSGHESALAALTSKVADELWQWYGPYVSMSSEAGYFLQSESSDKLSPLIASMQLYTGYTGRDRRGEERKDVVSDTTFAPDVYLAVIKFIESIVREDRVAIDCTESTVLMRAKKRAMEDAVPVAEEYTEYVYDSCLEGPGLTVLHPSDHPHSMPIHPMGDHVEKSNGYSTYWFPVPATADHSKSHTPSLLPGTPSEVQDSEKSVDTLQAELLTDMQVQFSQSVRASVRRGNNNKMKVAPAYLPPRRYTVIPYNFL
jgi:hypothetical protein